MKVCLLQMNSQSDKAANLAQAERLLRSALEAGRPDLVVLPEMFTWLGGAAGEARNFAETIPGGPAYTLLQNIAREYAVYIHGGSINERAGDNYYNTTLVFDREGRQIARYRKIHLFDVVTPDGKVYQESATYNGGDEIVTYQIDGHTIGCTICYDLRFPELYAALRDAGAEVIIVPAAFTLMTGKDHWEVLCRARAIETQTYLLAAGQVGTYREKGVERAVYGHSMVVDPWGLVMAQAQDKVSFIEATLDFEYLQKVRQSLPCHQHRVLKGTNRVVR